MSSLKIEERFSVNAPVERVWRFLLDPERIAPCLPGAELLEVENERTFHGQMKVKVGPVTVGYQGTIELTEVDEPGRRVQMLGKGKEKGGAGSAKMTMESRLEPHDDGSVAISVTSDVELAGRIVRFGRGMIQSVSAQLFKQFAGNVREALESAGDEPAAPAPAAAPAVPAADAGATSETATAAEAPGGEVDAAPVETAAQTPAEPEAAAPAEDGAPTRPAATAPAASERAPASTPAAIAAEPAGRAEPAPAQAATAARSLDTRPARDLSQRTAEPVRILPLLFRAFRDVIAGFFKRLFGRKA